jgi:hypothetical protein
MRSLTDRIARLVRSPQAQHLAHRAQQLARDPRPAARSRTCAPTWPANTDHPGRTRVGEGEMAPGPPDGA